MKKNMQGFTLIELMIVVAIIAILLVIAIPAYQDYTIRTRVSEGVNLAAAAKLAVAETRLDRGEWAANNAEAGYTSPTSKFVDGIEITDNGVITVTLSNDPGLGAAGGEDLVFTGNVDDADNPTRIDWTCTSTIDTKYLPSTCRP